APSQVKTSLRCLKRGRYESLGEDEDGEGVAAQDQRQNLNRTVGQVLVKVALVLLVLVTVLVMYRSKNDTLDPPLSDSRDAGGADGGVQEGFAAGSSPLGWRGASSCPRS
ncbi:unnamed protein product, partial [Prorocentrum cordatum]